jgi:hypothetical protein
MGLRIDMNIPGVQSGSGKVYKGIVPGNHKVRILKFSLPEEHWKNDDGLFLEMFMETEKPSPDFEGYPIDKENPDGPKHEGYVGKVRFSSWAYKTKYVPFKAKEVSRNELILEDLLRLCVELECVEWFRNAQDKYATIQEWVEAFNTEMPYKDKWLNVCIRGDQYLDKEGKLRTSLSFAKYEKIDGAYHNAYISANSKKKLLAFDPDKHYKKVEVPEVENFGDEDVDISNVDESYDTSDDSNPFNVDDVDTGFDI